MVYNRDINWQIIRVQVATEAMGMDEIMESILDLREEKCQRQNYSLNMPEYRQKQKHCKPQTAKHRDCDFFAIYNISPICSFLDKSY